MMNVACECGCGCVRERERVRESNDNVYDEWRINRTSCRTGSETSIKKKKTWKGFNIVWNVVIGFKNISFYQQKNKNKSGNIFWLGDSKRNYGEKEVQENK